MSLPTVGQSAEDEAAAQAVKRHHAQLAAGLNERVESLLSLLDSQRLLKAEQARQDLLTYLRSELVPHAQAEEQGLYPAAAARPEGALLVEGMLGEHQAITALVAELADGTSLVRAAGAARALAALFAVHLAKENDLVLPVILAAPDASLAQLLAGMHELLGAEEHGHGHDHGHGKAAEAAGGCGCGGCGCGGDQAQPGDTAEVPTLAIDARLDVRTIPHSRRHALVLSTVDSLALGEAVVLVASHAPRPVLAEIDTRFPGQIDAQWLQSGPEIWQVRLERIAPAKATASAG